jgi:hypothetical protein
MVRFDPDDLTKDLHVYALDGRYIGDAPAVDATGFLDVASAKARAQQEAALRRKTRELAALEDLLTAPQLAELLPDDGPDEDGASPTVIRPVRLRANAGRAVTQAEQAEAIALAVKRGQLIDRFDADDIVPPVEAAALLRRVV